MFQLFLNNDSGHTPDFLSLPPVVSNTITIMTVTALVMTMSDSSNRRESFSPPPLKTSRIAHLSGADGKTNQIKFNVKLYHLLFVSSLYFFVSESVQRDGQQQASISIFPIPFQANESSLTRTWDSSQILNSIWLVILIIMQMSALPEGESFLLNI